MLEDQNAWTPMLRRRREIPTLKGEMHPVLPTNRVLWMHPLEVNGGLSWVVIHLHPSEGRE